MKTLTKILLCILLVCFGVIFWLWKHPKIEKEYVTIAGKTPPPKIIYSTAKNGNQVATFTKPNPVLEPEKLASEELLNTVRNINEIEKAKIQELTKINTELQLKLSEKELAVNDAAKQIKVWKDKYNEIQVDNINNTVVAKSDVSPVIIEYDKRTKWYKAKEGFISMTSENPYIVFNGVEKYETKKKEVKDIFEITTDAKMGQYYYDRNFDPSLKYYDASLELMFNPDGRIRPYINGGVRTFYFQNYSPFYSIGAKILLLKY